MSAPDRDRELQHFVERLVASGGVTAAVAAAGAPRSIERAAWAGRTRRSGGREVRFGDLFDLASLTKGFTATLALALDRSSRLPLTQTVGEVWGEGATRGLADRTLEVVLRQRSGLRPWTPLYRRFRNPSAVHRYLLSDRALESRRERYGDLDYILWGLTAEHALGLDYDALLRREVLRPLGLSSVRREPGDRPAVVESVLANDREVALAHEQGLRVALRHAVDPGSAQDGNARFLGRRAAHAGLFASAGDLFDLGSEWLSPGGVLSAESVERALRSGRWFALGWRRATLRGSAGPALSPAAFGHLGFTGGSLWLDPEARQVMVLLAHRVSTVVDLKPWRRRFHRLVAGEARGR